MENPPKLPNVPEDKESKETTQEVFGRILRESKELGTGKDGIVFMVEVGKLDKAERHMLVEEHLMAEGEEAAALAAKILKVYDPSVGEHEFTMQKRARDILLDVPGAVRIPDASTVQNMHVGADVCSYLNSHGAHLHAHAEVIMMDYIDGQDLGMLMYDFVLRKAGHDDDYVKDLSYSQKEQLVGQELGFEHPDLGRAQTLEERESAQAMTSNRNEDRLLKYLHHEGFTLDPSIFEKIDTSVQALNKNGIYHNDLHKRNIMIDKDGEVYIIDFGRAESEKRKDGISDMLFSKKWKILSVSEEAQEQQEDLEALSKIVRLEKQLLVHPKHHAIINSFIESVKKEGHKPLQKEFALSRGDDSRFERFLIMIKLVGEAGGEEKETTSHFIEEIDKGGAGALRPFERNLLHKFQEVGYL